MTDDHPPIQSLPVAVWGDRKHRLPWIEEYTTWALEVIRRAVAAGTRPIDPEAQALLRYRPELCAQIGPALLTLPDVRNFLATEPACALALLIADYESVVDLAEPWLAGCGECIYHLLRHAGTADFALRQQEAWYRHTLVVDSYWGLRYARETNNAGLAAEIATWCEDEHKHYAAAAVYFLLRRSTEPVGPYVDTILANPFYAYVALPQLSLRGFSVSADSIDMPRWACHFGRSAFAGRNDSFVPTAARDPLWLIELAASRGWLRDAARLPGIGRLISEHGAGHPMERLALRFLVEAKRQRGGPAIATI